MANVGRMVKESSVEEITTRLSERPNFFITAVNGLPADDTDALRQKLFTTQSRLLMIKRRLGLRAVEPLKIAGLPELLQGSVGLVLAGEDALLTAKHIVEFRKAHEGGLAVLGAIIDGQLLDKSHVEQLAALPSKPVLLAQLVATIESPMSDLICAIEQLIGDVAWVAEQAAEKKPKTDPTPPTQEEGPSS